MLASCVLQSGTVASLLQVLQALSIEEYVAMPSQQTAFGRARVFKLRMQFFPEQLYPKEAGISFADVAQVFKTSFMVKLQVSDLCQPPFTI